MTFFLRFFFSVSLLSAFVSSISAQSIDSSQALYQVSGKTVDAKTNLPVDFATVSLSVISAPQPMKVLQSAADGSFTIAGLKAGTYTLKISFLGYQPFTSGAIILNPEKPEQNFGTIKLAPSKSTVLNEVVIEAERNTIQLGIDRKVFSVNQSLVSEGGSATDLLANVPSVSVDIDGNVNLRGTSNVRVLIDGKPSSLGGGNIAQILQSLPASAIESIELVTNPSSKYDAEGQSGIINIVLKKNKKIGVNGSLSASGGSNNNYNASTNLSFRNAKMNLYGNYSFRNGNRIGGGFNNTQFLSTNGMVNNITESTRNDINNTIKLGADYYLNAKTTIGVSGNLNFRDNNSLENLDYLVANIPDQNGSSFRTTDRNGKSSGYDISMDFSRQFEKKGHNLTANFSFGKSTEDNKQGFNQLFYTAEGSRRDSVNKRDNDNSEVNSNYNIQIDYTLPINKTQKLEAGIRTTLSNNDETQLSKLLYSTTNEYNIDYSLSNDFLLDDQVYAVYSTYQNQISKNFGIQFGVRAEQAYLNTQYKPYGTSNVDITMGNLDYLRLYPSIFLTQKLKNDQQLQMSYSRRVNRPRGWQINPFVDISDPNNIRMGNPGLKPEDINSFELSYIKYLKGLTFTSSAYFRQVNDVVEGIRLPLPDNNAATITQFYNLTQSQSSGIEVIAKADFSKSFNITSNINLFYSEFKGNDEFNIKSSNGFNWNGNLSSNLTLVKNLTAQINGNYRAPRVGAQGRSMAMYGVDAALRLEMLKNKAGSISFNIRDILNSRKWGQTTETEFFIQESERRMQGRLATLTFSYRFGKQDIGSRKRNEKDQKETRPEEEFNN